MAGWLLHRFITVFYYQLPCIFVSAVSFWAERETARRVNLKHFLSENSIRVDLESLEEWCLKCYRQVTFSQGPWGCTEWVRGRKEGGFIFRIGYSMLESWNQVCIFKGRDVKGIHKITGPSGFVNLILMDNYGILSGGFQGQPPMEIKIFSICLWLFLGF